MGTIHVLYTCSLCMLRDIGVDVVERTDDQDVVDWFEHVALPALVADHTRRSPKCRPKVFTNIKIPVDTQDGMVGKAIKD